MTNPDTQTLLDAIADTQRVHRRQRFVEALVGSAIPASLLVAGGIVAAGLSGASAWSWIAAAGAMAIFGIAIAKTLRRRETEESAALSLDHRLESQERCISALACLRGEVRSALSDVIVTQAAERIRAAGVAAVPATMWPRRTAWAAVGIAFAAISALWPWTPRTPALDRSARVTPAGDDVSTMLASLGTVADHPALVEARRETASDAPGGVRPSTAAAAAGALRRLETVREWSESLAETLAPAPSPSEAAAALDRAIDAARRGTLSPTNRAAAQVTCPLPTEALSEFPACASAATRIETALQNDDLAALTEALIALRDSLPAPAAAAKVGRLAEAFAAQAGTPGGASGLTGGAGNLRPPVPAGISDAPGLPARGVPPGAPTPGDFVLRSESSRAEAMRRHDWPEAYDDCVRRYFERGVSADRDTPR